MDINKALMGLIRVGGVVCRRQTWGNLKHVHIEDEELILTTEKGGETPYSPTVNDLLADDWILV